MSVWFVTLDEFGLEKKKLNTSQDCCLTEELKSNHSQVKLILSSSSCRLNQPPPAPSASLQSNLWVKELLSQKPGPPSCHPPPRPLPPPRLPPPQGQGSSQSGARHSETWWSWPKMAWPSRSVVTLLQTLTEVTHSHREVISWERQSAFSLSFVLTKTFQKVLFFCAYFESLKSKPILHLTYLHEAFYEM